MSNYLNKEGINVTEDHQLIRDILLSSVEEQRKKRRWSIVLRLLFLVWLFIMLFSVLWSVDKQPSGSEYVALVDIKGVIADDRETNADTVTNGLKRAFADPKVQGVILRINSPGGSPVQAGQIYDEIGRLKATRPDLKVYAAITDTGASAAYYIAAAADQIYANRASVVGSIGAYMATFGFEQAMEKAGVARRFYGSGDHKALTDPFQPEDPVAAAHLRATVKNIHEQFIARVKAGRKGRLTTEDKLFSGLIWTGEQALSLGLVDGLGSPGYLARELIGCEQIVDFTDKPSLIENVARTVGSHAALTLESHLGLNGWQVR